MTGALVDGPLSFTGTGRSPASAAPLAELHWPMNPSHPHTRRDLVRIAIEVMSERGLEPEFPADRGRGFIDFVLVD